MKRWERLEEYLFDADALGIEFNSIAYSEDTGLPRSEASKDIQAYLDAQRHPKSTTLFVLHRRGRTTSAMWHVGERTADVRSNAKQTANDFRRRIERAFEPDLQRIIQKNPRAGKVAQAALTAFEANVEALVTLGED